MYSLEETLLVHKPEKVPIWVDISVDVLSPVHTRGHSYFMLFKLLTSFKVNSVLGSSIPGFFSLVWEMLGTCCEIETYDEELLEAY